MALDRHSLWAFRAELASLLACMVSAVTVTNAGDLYGEGGNLTVTGDVTHSGLVEAFNGDLTVDGSVSGPGKAKVFGPGILEVDGALPENVVFAAKSSGKLVLGDSAAFTGTLIGFSQTRANSLDMKDIAFAAGTTKATYAPTPGHSTTGGVLTVADGAQIATIKISGNYTASTFTSSSDGHGGTIVTDPAAAAGIQAFTSTLASFGPGGSATGSVSQPTRGLEHPILAAPG
jgi:hypothetical protein